MWPCQQVSLGNEVRHELCDFFRLNNIKKCTQVNSTWDISMLKTSLFPLPLIFPWHMVICQVTALCSEDVWALTRPPLRRTLLSVFSPERHSYRRYYKSPNCRNYLKHPDPGYVYMHTQYLFYTLDCWARRERNSVLWNWRPHLTGMPQCNARHYCWLPRSIITQTLSLKAWGITLQSYLFIFKEQYFHKFWCHIRLNSFLAGFKRFWFFFL